MFLSQYITVRIVIRFSHNIDRNFIPDSVSIDLVDVLEKRKYAPIEKEVFCDVNKKIVDLASDTNAEELIESHQDTIT